MRSTLRRVFLGAEVLLYLIFLYMDLMHSGDSTVPKFLSICLVGLTGALFAAHSEIRLGLIFTVAADVFLLLLNRYYPVGIMLFIIVQICYALYLDDTHGMIPRLICITLSSILFYRYGLLETLAAVYITLFLCNVIRAGVKCRENPLFFIGMLLFFCCDICVGLYHTCTGAVWEFVRVAMWAFYLPGQVLILLSSWKTGGTNE